MFCAYLAKSKLPRKELARRLGCSSEFLTMIANGIRAPARYDLVEAFRKVAGIPPEAWAEVDSAPPST